MGIILFIIFLIVSLLLLMGKDSFLIAGYNTASAKEKAQYNEKKLCRIVGVGLLIVTLGIGSLMIFDSLGLYLMIGSFLIGIAIILIGSQFATIVPVKKLNRSLIGSMIAVLLISGLICFVMFTGNIQIEYQSTSLHLSGSLVSDSQINYEDIVQIEYREDFDVGRKKNGVNNAKIEAGRYENDELGTYRLYSYTNSPAYVLIETKEGWYVISDQTEKQTFKLYQKLQSILK